MDSLPYVGRFAPSPSGPLHFGSLVTALASFFDARANNGQWLVRVENIDPPREQPGSVEKILTALATYGMHWDGEIVYQSQRYNEYQSVLDTLLETNTLYPCTCSRKKLTGLSGIYPGYCRNQPANFDRPHALRLKCTAKKTPFDDLIQGSQQLSPATLGDFILKRKDQLYAYQLAVTVDDALQGITHVVRGYDLLESTPRQLYLQTVLNYQHPIYAHIPVITKKKGGAKLSKQNHATPLPLDEPRPLLIKAMTALGLTPHSALETATVNNIIDWGIKHWDIHAVPKQATIALPTLA